MLQISEQDFNTLIGLIKEKYGINLSGKKTLVEARLTNHILNSGYDNFHDYLQTVFENNSEEMANVINKLTTNHTYFMREHEHFSHFTEVFLPYAEKNISDKDLRIWSAGCSYGNEPYNLAMCMDEYFGLNKSKWDLKILATDISMYALKTAMRGIYSESAMEKLSEKWRSKYFVKTENGLYAVCDEIKNNVIFKYHNLMEPILFKKKFDLIMCRNVMIYFDEQTKSSLCKKFYNAQEKGGYFYMGHAESAPLDIPYEKESPSIYRKVGKTK